MKKPALSVILDLLSQSPVLSSVPKVQLQWLAEQADYLLLKKGEPLFRIGDPIDKMAVLLRGHVVDKLQQNGNPKEVNALKSGDLSGALPYSRATTAIAETEAKEDSELLMLSTEHFPEMIRQHYELTTVLVHTMTSRVRRYTESQQQSEKMAALGKLSAGLAHELNNPAAAVVRSAAALQENLHYLSASLTEILRSQRNIKAMETIQQLLEEQQSAGNSKTLSLLEKSNNEDKLADWLSEKNVEKPHNLAETLAGLQLPKEELEAAFSQLEPAQLPPVLNWICRMLNIKSLAKEIHESSHRISELVQAVKSYSHMDRSPEKEEADLRQGIRNTLTMLNFKIRKKQVKVSLNSPEEMPTACVYAGELNQLWTNLIDNAIDAVEQGGKIDISFSVQDKEIKVSIKDNGKGIPEDEKQKIFDPFYTTKVSGEGSGLGLDIVKRIIEHHEGRVELHSEPGNTQFNIYIPL